MIPLEEIGFHLRLHREGRDGDDKSSSNNDDKSSGDNNDSK